MKLTQIEALRLIDKTGSLMWVRRPPLPLLILWNNLRRQGFIARGRFRGENGKWVLTPAGRAALGEGDG